MKRRNMRDRKTVRDRDEEALQDGGREEETRIECIRLKGNALAVSWVHENRNEINSWKTISR